MPVDVKEEIPLLMLLLGILTFATQTVGKPVKSRGAFYVLLGILLYTNLFQLTDILINNFHPDDGRMVDNTGGRHRLMQLNGLWGVLIAAIATPLVLLLYHYKAARNKKLEMALTMAFILWAVVVYMR